MKKRLFYIWLFIGGILWTSSCKKLDEQPDHFIDPSGFYNSKAQIEAAFAASMNFLWSYWEGYGYTGSIFSHDDQLNGGNLIFSSTHGQALWNAHYRAILNLNHTILALSNGNLQESTVEEADQLMGQAKFLRAYNYFMLVRMFGDLPLITEQTEDPITADIGRSPIADVYQLIESDFLEAVDKLPPTWPPDQKGKPTKDAAKGLLAKAYLTMATAPLNEVSNYEKAARYAGEVIEDGRYSLVEDVNEVFSLGTKYGPEVLWGFNSNYEDISTDPQIWAPEIAGGWGDMGVYPNWEQTFPEQPRKYAYLLVEYDGLHYTEWPSAKIPGIKKFLYDLQEDFDAYRSVVNFPIIRYADVLLIFAEAENKVNNGPTAAALDAINQVIDRANGYRENPSYPRLTASLTVEEFDVAVIEERNFELCFENDRWFDLVRKRILGEKNPEWITNFSDDDYLFPIPETDLELNPSLIPNPGY